MQYYADFVGLEWKREQTKKEFLGFFKKKKIKRNESLLMYLECNDELRCYDITIMVKQYCCKNYFTQDFLHDFEKMLRKSNIIINEYGRLLNFRKILLLYHKNNKKL